MVKRIFFDLDGTLTDSGEGIINSVIYALEKLNIPYASRSELTYFIGPPLRDSFLKFGVKDCDVSKAVSYYRERYKTIGIYENKVYLGVEDMLKKLVKRGFELYIATSKPTDQAITVLTHFGLLKYFKLVAGATYDGTRDNKISVLKYLIQTIGGNENCIMVGDTIHDVVGACSVNIKAVAVAYGFGDKNELKNSNAIFLSNTVLELENFLLGLYE